MFVQAKIGPVAAVFFSVTVCGLVGDAGAVEHARLTEENWRELAPQGKEADRIYGDHVLRNDKIVAVIAEPTEGRNANMTVRNVRGAVIDLSVRGDGPQAPENLQEISGISGKWATNDQLSAFYPLGAQFVWTAANSPVEHGDSRTSLRLDGESVYSNDAASQLKAELTYILADGDKHLLVVTKVENTGRQPAPFRLEDRVRADGEFANGHDNQLGLGWMYDSFWGQAYGVMAAGDEFRLTTANFEGGRDGNTLRYSKGDGHAVTLEPGESVTFERYLFPGAHLAAVRTVAHKLRGDEVKKVQLTVTDHAGPVVHAMVAIKVDSEEIVVGRTDADGRIEGVAPAGKFNLVVSSPAHPPQEVAIDTAQGPEFTAELASPGYVAAQIVDEAGGPIACKVQFIGRDSTPNPNFGPDSAVFGVRNLRYTPNGEFRTGLIPGSYDAIVSRGTEFDIVRTQLTVTAAKETRLEATLVRSVDTKGWISSDFHSHSSPSGDNTASQRGRVLNLVAEHIEFIPCTEHNRISTYDYYLEELRLDNQVATCSGMELTGSPLPLNHQNAFPLVHKPRTQDGGGPTTTVNPIQQIERLAMWDDGADKLVQTNHPNIVQMLGDRDQDGQADGGFEKMFHVMDVIEVHPPEAILDKPESLPANARESGNVIFNWLQLLNLGYRVPGVVNTDAHWNFHGSGWLRNYIRCSTDQPNDASVAELVDASEKGQIVMTNGPFLEVEATSEQTPNDKAGPGDDLTAEDGKIQLWVKVQCANWLTVNRIQVFVNGRPIEPLNFTARANRELFSDGAVVFEQTLPVELESDAHIVVAAAGEGEKLGVVYGPGAGGATPIAVSNPIFVDVDGGGFQPNGDMLDLPLPVQGDGIVQ